MTALSNAKITFANSKKPPKESVVLTETTFRILGIAVLLSQLPLLLHLPLWLSIPGALLVLLKILPTDINRFQLNQALILVAVIMSGAMVFGYYGHIFGRDPCVAFLYLLLSFKFFESKRSYDASLLVVLCSFLLLTQFFYKQTILAAILTIPAMFFVGLAMFSLQRGASQLDIRSMVYLTSKLFLQAMPIAILLFVVVPRVSQPGHSGNGSGDAQTGLSSRMSMGSFGTLSKSNEVAFRVEFDGAPPARQNRYWRGPVLTGYDGYDWYVLPSQPIAHAPNVAGQPLSYTVTMPASYQPWILALDTPASTPTLVNEQSLEVSLTDNLQINTSTPVSSLLRYSASSVLSDRFTPVVQPGAQNLFVSSTNPKAQAWAQELRKQYTDHDQLARAIMLHFNRESFYYTLSPPPVGVNSIDDFLFDTRSGFCEYYAGSFVFLLRAAGVPARVVTGYQGGEINNGYMIVKQSDAHAWAEAYIDGQWRRYDPTGAVSPLRVEEGANASLRNDPAHGFLSKVNIPLVKSLQLKWDAVNFAWQKRIVNFDREKQKALWRKIGIDKPSGWMIVLLVISAVMLWTLIIIKPLSLHAREKLSPCEKTWRKLCLQLRTHGLQRHTGETYSDFISRASCVWPDQAPQLNRIACLYQTALFSNGSEDIIQNKAIADQMADVLKDMGRLGKPAPV